MYQLLFLLQHVNTYHEYIVRFFKKGMVFFHKAVYQLWGSWRGAAVVSGLPLTQDIKIP